MRPIALPIGRSESIEAAKCLPREIRMIRSSSSTLAIGAMLDGIKDGGKSNANLIWVSKESLTQQKVEAWSDMPVWTGKESGLARASISRARSKGLTFRPLADTARDTLA